MYYNDDTTIYFDGKFMKAKDAGTDLYSQSLHYGYSVLKASNPTAQIMELKFSKQKNTTKDLRDRQNSCIFLLIIP